jgi:hypothetical protein
MIQDTKVLQLTTPPPSIIKDLFAKVGAQLYRVELKHKVNGLFCLRPITGEPYKYLLLPAEKVRRLQLFPIFGA